MVGFWGLGFRVEAGFRIQKQEEFVKLSSVPRSRRTRAEKCKTERLRRAGAEVAGQEQQGKGQVRQMAEVPLKAWQLSNWIKKNRRHLEEGLQMTGRMTDLIVDFYRAMIMLDNGDSLWIFSRRSTLNQKQKPTALNSF